MKRTGNVLNRLVTKTNGLSEQMLRRNDIHQRFEQLDLQNIKLRDTVEKLTH